MPKVATLNSIYPTDCETLLELRERYATCRYDLNRGYIAYQIQKPSRHYEHRLVADIIFGGIPNGHHVHHINEIITDNRAINLRLLSPEEHAKLHKLPTGQILICPICAEPFWATKSRQKRRQANYCSPQCVSLSQRVADRPSKKNLALLLSDMPNFMAVGRLYGVDGNTIRKWCQGYDLPTKITEWKNRGV